MKFTTTQKAEITTTAARFYRHADGRITKREAQKLGRLYAIDLHWKFMGTSGDKLASRACPAHRYSFAERFAEAKKHGWLAEFAQHLKDDMCWYGPNGGLWPGERLVFVMTAIGGGWVLPETAARLARPGLAKAQPEAEEADRAAV